MGLGGDTRLSCPLRTTNKHIVHLRLRGSNRSVLRAIKLRSRSAALVPPGGDGFARSEQGTLSIDATGRPAVDLQTAVAQIQKPVFGDDVAGVGSGLVESIVSQGAIDDFDQEDGGAG